ncbi:aminoglycoside phosphotransferase family protein [uncultured Nocardioides sp.]|uniref:aminoglycoside phosphotransferase family protein n=1 Tax=uncultured Nocardioides sp. TaxID=198441 RepID=UPI00262E6089|nr:aminoglycoside phosphotransferase family protein [uncultured Nocardioides sp.]
MTSALPPETARSLAAVSRSLVGEWGLTPDPDEGWGRSSHVVPVRTADGVPAVLKVAAGDPATEHEALALQHWGGRGAVRLLRADPRRRAVLLERLERRDLTQEWDVHACEAVADLYRLLHVPAPPQLQPLTEHVGRHVEPLAALPRDAPLPRRMVEQCLAHLRDLGADAASTGTLVHGDLHYENVLADTTGEWVAIAPRALSGDPHWEPAPLLWNRLEEAEGDVRRTVRVRFETVVDAAGLDEDRARAWAVVRLVLNAFWSVRSERPDPAYVTRMLTVLKAVQS